MCGRFTLHHTPEMLAAIFGLPGMPSVVPRYNIAPSQPVLIVRQQPDGRRELTHVNWGLIPSWSKDPAIGQGLINARSETVAEKPSFRAAFRHRRCIVPASGYYEWQAGGPGRKQPWYITAATGEPLSMAGLWETWQSPDGSVIETCAIITTTANRLTAAIHGRMPVLLPDGALAAWLDRNTPPAGLVGLLEPCAEAALTAYPVATLVNAPVHDSPACIEPLSGTTPP